MIGEVITAVLVQLRSGSIRNSGNLEEYLRGLLVT